MAKDVMQTAIMRTLSSQCPVFYGNVLKLREMVEDWLTYIPATFRTYTRHTVGHSDEIIRQVSRLLYSDDDPARAAVELSPSEMYVLVIAAYLHDVGMVASEAEKAEILSSDQWKAWVAEGGAGNRRWLEVQALRDGDRPPLLDLRHFLADVHLRYLLSDFIRRGHHRRAADFIRVNSTMLEPLLGNRELLDVVSEVCVAHGLHQHELEDKTRFPERRDVLDYTVNVRFVAILLRLGDLLDMSSDRACPLLLNAASPIPPDDLAHWTQYQRFTHRLTTPDRIEVTALCRTQDEHRLIRDWCEWLVSEVKFAAVTMSRAARHGNWKPPTADIAGPNPSIIIEPAPGANYIPSDWTFRLDTQAILDRLIHDVYESPMSFVRELIQNALDANRCQMYLDLEKDGIPTPDFPTMVSDERRQRYPVHVTLREIQVTVSMSEEVETRQVLTIEDHGIGMDRDIIERYFLQVGRSYYATPEFRKRFRFAPTSRFGVGFLSVFGASDKVIVETFKPSSPDGPIRLTLLGARSYLLTERGNRRTNGTKIEVQLREPLAKGSLLELVAGWCRRVEFPVQVHELGAMHTIVGESQNQFVAEATDHSENDSRLVVRQFPANRNGIEGDLYVFSRQTARGESWTSGDWAQSTYVERYPQAEVPELPGSIICLHGIVLERLRTSNTTWSMRLDYRKNSSFVTLARERKSVGRRLSAREDTLDAEIISRWVELLSEHLEQTPLAVGPSSWGYKQRLYQRFPFHSFWAGVPGVVPVFRFNQVLSLSLSELVRKPTLTVVVDKARDRERLPESAEDAWIMFDNHLSNLPTEAKRFLFDNRSIDNARLLDDRLLALDLVNGGDVRPLHKVGFKRLTFGPVPVSDLVCLRTRFWDRTDVLINESNPMGQWVRTVLGKGLESGQLRQSQVEKLIELLVDHSAYGYSIRLKPYMQGWRDIKDLPQDLYPPDIELTPRMFNFQ